jgi:hypothetical protein
VTYSIRSRSRVAGITLAELTVSSGIAFVILGILVLAGAAINHRLWATEKFLKEVGNENRMMDSVAADLRRAVRVSILSGSSSTPIKDTGDTYYAINNSSTLVIGIPDYYGSNTPDNTKGSSYKSSRYPRATLNSSPTYNSNGVSLLNGIVPWTDAQIMRGSKRVTRFAPLSAASDEIQVRYYTGARSASDPTLCLFRAEYPPGSSTPSAIREVAERISDARSTTLLSISGRNGGAILRLKSSFTPVFQRASSSAPTTAYVDANIRNPRRD